MKERLRRWLLAKILGPQAYTLQPLPVQAGDFIQIEGKNPERTGNTPQVLQVVSATLHVCVVARYRDGSISSFVYKPEQLILAKQAAARG